MLSDQCCIEGETKADEWSSGGGRGGGGWPYEKKEGGKREGEVSDARPYYAVQETNALVDTVREREKRGRR